MPGLLERKRVEVIKEDRIMKKSAKSDDGENLDLCQNHSPESSATEDLQQLLQALPPGEISSNLGIDRKLAKCWGRVRRARSRTKAENAHSVSEGARGSPQ